MSAIRTGRYIEAPTVPNKYMQGKPDAALPFNTNLRPTDDPIITSGKELWWYHACGGSETGWVSRMADLPAIYSRMFQWLTDRYQIGHAAPGPQTELYFETVYAYQYDDPNRPNDSATDPWQNIFYFGGQGDGTFFYPGRPDKIGGTTHIPISSIRMKMLARLLPDRFADTASVWRPSAKILHHLKRLTLLGVVLFFGTHCISKPNRDHRSAGRAFLSLIGNFFGYPASVPLRTAIQEPS